MKHILVDSLIFFQYDAMISHKNQISVKLYLYSISLLINIKLP